MSVEREEQPLISLPSRFWNKVDLDGSGNCWNWTGTLDITGYGRFKWNKKLWLTHCLIWVAMKGEIPEGSQIDHLCRNRACCNPRHLEVVTRKENILRGVGPTAVNAVKQVCKNGHPLEEGNLVLAQVKRGYRTCLICNREWDRAYKRRRRAEGATW